MHGSKGACMAGDLYGRRDGHCSGRYASFWNAFLFHLCLQQTKKEENSKSKPNTHSTKDSPDAKLSPSDRQSNSRQRIKSQESDIVINWKGSSTEPETDYGTTYTSFFTLKVNYIILERTTSKVNVLSFFLVGAESEPFIVSHPDDENQNQMIITVTERYVLEKDLNGDVLESLDLKCLQVR